MPARTGRGRGRRATYFLGVGHSHQHAAAAAGEDRRVAIALGLIVAIMAAEIAAGAIARSLALLSDAGHMLADAGALALSLFAMRIAARPARGAMTFGFRRVEILSALASGVTLLVIAGFVTYEAIVRLGSPPHVRAGLVLGVALGGLAANAVAARTLAGGDRSSLNLEGSFQHVLTDAYGFAGTAVAAAVILITGFQRADPIVSLLIAALMLRSGYSLVRASGRVFLEAAPEGIDPQAVGEALIGLDGVIEVHDLHVWEISSGFPALSAHVLVARERDCHDARRAMEDLLRERFGLEHTTLQVDHAGRDLLKIESRAAAAPRR
jgi:cobalt-zinc-cadmium efflux system protein